MLTLATGSGSPSLRTYRQPRTLCECFSHSSCRSVSCAARRLVFRRRQQCLKALAHISALVIQCVIISVCSVIPLNHSSGDPRGPWRRNFTYPRRQILHNRFFAYVVFKVSPLTWLIKLAAANLTTWGYYDCQRDMNNGGSGGESKPPPALYLAAF